jgi:hypothetical protein
VGANVGRKIIPLKHYIASLGILKLIFPTSALILEAVLSYPILFLFSKGEKS